MVNCPIGTFVKEKQHSAVMAKHVMCHNKKKQLSTPYFGVLHCLCNACGARFKYLAITLQRVVQMTLFFGSIPKIKIYEHLIF